MNDIFQHSLSYRIQFRPHCSLLLFDTDERHVRPLRTTDIIIGPIVEFVP